LLSISLVASFRLVLRRIFSWNRYLVSPFARQQTCYVSGWLYRTAVYLAANRRRREMRREVRERTAVELRDRQQDGDSVWRNLIPVLNEVLGELPVRDRDALLLRYYERKKLGELALILGLGERAAQKRVQRALDRLRRRFQHRGITVCAGTVGTSLFTRTIHPPPLDLINRTCFSASQSAHAATGSALGTSLIFHIMTATQIKTALVVVFVAAIPLGWQWNTIRNLKRDLRATENRLVASGAARGAPPMVSLLGSSWGRPGVVLRR
jgi:RNA polymerase sigma factor (sigma-70 family)